MKTRTFTVLATLLVIEGVMIGQVLSRPGAAKEPAKTEATVAQDKKEENCKAVVNPIEKRDCWVRKAKAGEKNLQGATLSGAKLDGIKTNKDTKGLPPSP